MARRAGSRYSEMMLFEPSAGSRKKKNGWSAQDSAVGGKLIERSTYGGSFLTYDAASITKVESTKIGRRGWCELQQGNDQDEANADGALMRSPKKVLCAAVDLIMDGRGRDATKRGGSQFMHAPQRCQ